MNLCTNASQAMRDTGGILQVTLEPVNLDPEQAAAYHELKPGPYIRLQVKDTGCGMDKLALERIFEPYFTTKAKGEGTGLGLAVVHGIVSGYQGRILVESEPDQGATFDIYLPRMTRSGKRKRVVDTKPLPRGTERILFVDDELALVEIGRALLSRLGYDVVTRTSSIEAFELFRAQPDRFDLIITDMTMPNLTGLDLSQKMLKIRPALPIILCTGFSESISEEKVKQIGIREFVMKPLVMKDMAHTLRQVLDG
jgi:CheY-like chemotaxis protein